jgi:uncharacterized protein
VNPPESSTDLLTEPAPEAEGAPPKLLALDGGGVRGLIPAMVLVELEERTGRRTAELFDLVSGTSTGGIIAAFLASPGPDGRGGPASDVIRFYTEECPKIFHHSLKRKVTSVGGLVDEKYSAAQLEKSLKLALGEETMLRDTVTDLVVTAYDIEGRRPFFFKSARAKQEGHKDYPLWLVARCTSAAPTFFEPVEVHSGGHMHALIDGGVYVNNPSMSAYAEVCSGRARHALLVSLGTGRRTTPMKISEAKHWGLAHWARPLLEIVFDGVSDVVDYQLDQLLGDRHVRLQAMLHSASESFDDASMENLEALKQQGQELIAERSEDIDRLCEALVE